MQGNRPRPAGSKQGVAPGFGGRVDGKQGRDGDERVAGNGRSQFHILLDHVRAVG